VTVAQADVGNIEFASQRTMRLQLFCLMMLNLLVAGAEDIVVINVAIDTKHEMETVDEMFIGVTFDSSQFGAHWRKVNFTYANFCLSM
jgi:hypothetical protein